MVYLVPFLHKKPPRRAAARQQAPSHLTSSQADGLISTIPRPTLRRLAAYESTGAAGDVGLSNVLRCSQPSQGEPPRRAATRQQAPSHAAPSQADGLMSTIPCEGWSCREANLAKAHPYEPLAQRAMSAWPMFSGAASLRKGIARRQPCAGSPHTSPLAQRAMSACPMFSGAVSLRKGIAKSQPCEGLPHTNPLAQRAMSAWPMRSGAASLRKGRV